MMSLLLALTAVAAVALVGSLAVRRRTRSSGLELWPEASGSRSVMARQRILADSLPTVPEKVVHLPVGPGAEGAQAARRLLDRPEAA